MIAATYNSTHTAKPAAAVAAVTDPTDDAARATTLLCTAAEPLWAALSASVYSNTTVWQNGLSYSTATTTPRPGAAAPESALITGYDLFTSVYHARALIQLASALKAAAAAAEGMPAASTSPMCTTAAAAVVAAANTVVSSIATALAGPLLWDDGVGMYVPSSGNNSHNTDVWGSCL